MQHLEGPPCGGCSPPVLKKTGWLYRETNIDIYLNGTSMQKPNHSNNGESYSNPSTWWT